jgi:FixJ family two-component response regulator
MADMAGDEEPKICIVDDEASVRKALVRLMRSAGIPAVSYASVDELLSEPVLPQYACIVADIRMQGDSGLTLPGLLAERGLDVPVIFVSAQDTEETRAAAKRAGAAGFFRKPVDDQALLDALAWAIRSDNRKNHA